MRGGYRARVVLIDLEHKTVVIGGEHPDRVRDRNCVRAITTADGKDIELIALADTRYRRGKPRYRDMHCPGRGPQLVRKTHRGRSLWRRELRSQGCGEEHGRTGQEKCASRRNSPRPGDQRWEHSAAAKPAR